MRTNRVRRSSVVIGESTPKEPEKRSGLFSKLALRRQETHDHAEHPEPSVKIEAEEVIPAVSGKEEQISLETEAEQLYREADAEAMAAEMKLPHRKKAEPAPRMSAEEVRAARESSIMKLKRQPEGAPVIDAEALSEQERQFDTTKLDISGIVGFKGELDDQMKMIEDLPAESSRKGGDGE